MMGLQPSAMSAPRIRAGGKPFPGRGEVSDAQLLEGILEGYRARLFP